MFLASDCQTSLCQCLAKSFFFFKQTIKKPFLLKFLRPQSLEIT